MISRAVLLVDRIATLLLALALGLVGALGVWWWIGTPSLPDRSDLSRVRELVADGWWPWASAVVGVLLVLLGVRWLVAHLANPRVPGLLLAGSGATGTLSIDGGRAAGAAAEAFADSLGVRSASGTIRRDRGQLVARIRAVLEPEADLAELADRADEVATLLAQVVGREDLRCSVELRVARPSSSNKLA